MRSLFLGVTMAAAAVWAAPALASSAALVAQGRALIGEGKLADASAVLREAVRVDPHDGEAWNALAAALNRSEMYAEALPAAARAAELAPQDAVIRYNLGLVLWEHGRFAEAVAAFDRALALRPRFAPALTERGTSLAALGRIEEARADWAAAEAADPDYVWVHYYRGVTEVVLGGGESAIGALDRIAKQQPEHLGAQLWRWVAYRRAGRPAPDLPRAPEWPGPIAAYLSDRMSATELEAEANRLALGIDQRRLASALYFIAQKMLLSGDREGAAAHLERLLSMSVPGHPEVQAARLDRGRLGVAVKFGGAWSFEAR